MTPSLCGSCVRDKRSLVACTWTITTVLTLLAFIISFGMIIQVHTHYRWLERNDQRYDENRRYMEEGNGGGHNGEGEGKGGQGESGDHHSGDNEDEPESYSLASMSSGSVTFVAFYTMMIATGLSLYGSTAIVGFTSLRGDYIAPCFSSSTSSTLRLGMFGGAIILFANLLLVCAVFFGEVTVEDWKEYREGEEREPYEIERISTIMAVTCMFLAALYSIFAILLFLFFGSIEGDELDEDGIIGTNALKSIAIDPRRENFITLGEPS